MRAGLGRIVVLAALLAGSALARGADGPVDPAVREAARGVKQVVAHRGSSADRPECTLAAVRRAIEVGATTTEVDVRRTKDGALVILHDATVDRTTDGTGPISALTLAEARKLDAGSRFDPRWKNERIPTLAEVLQAAHGRIDVLLDLKEQGRDYDEAVAAEVRRAGDGTGAGTGIVVGVRSIAQARLFRELLPKARQLGLIGTQEEIEAYARAGVETIRLWPKWLKAEGSDPLVARLRAAGAKLHLSGTLGSREELLPLLRHRPDSLSADDPARLIGTLRELGRE